MNDAAQEGPGGENDPPGRDEGAVGEHDAGDRAGRVEPNVLDRGGADLQPGGLGEQFLHRPAVQLAVGLGARPAHGRALAAIEDAELDAGAVDRPAHDPVERVDLAHEMALGEAANRRVARHLADRLDLMGQQQRAGAEASRRSRSFAAGVAAADHDDVV